MCVCGWVAVSVSASLCGRETERERENKQKERERESERPSPTQPYLRQRKREHPATSHLSHGVDGWTKVLDLMGDTLELTAIPFPSSSWQLLHDVLCLANGKVFDG